MNQERIQQLKELLAEDPLDSFCLYGLALEYASHPDSLPLAIETLELLKQSDPNYLPMYYQLGLLYAQQQQKEQAKETLQEGLRLAEKLGNKHTYTELEFLLDDIE